MSKLFAKRNFQLGVDDDGVPVKVKIGDEVEVKSVKSGSTWTHDLVNGVRAKPGFIREMLAAGKLTSVSQPKAPAKKSA